MTNPTTMAFDCHAHVYETVPAVGRPRSPPPGPAPVQAWRAHLEAHGLSGGVLVQPGFLGTNNAQMLDALARLPAGRFAGVAVVSPRCSAAVMGALATAGVRGLRWNLVEGAPLPDPEDRWVRGFLARAEAAGLHLELHLEGPRLADYLPRLLARCARLVIDHHGLPAAADPAADAGFRAIAAAAPSGRVWVKLSAPYRSAATPAHARALAGVLGSERLVWGSDWPWTRHEANADYTALIGHPAWAGVDAAALNGTARALYGLSG